MIVWPARQVVDEGLGGAAFHFSRVSLAIQLILAGGCWWWSVPGFSCCGLLAQASEFFFVAFDVGCELAECGAQMFDVGGESGEGVGFAAAGAVFFDDRA